MIYVAGIGPGGRQGRTFAAQAALEKSGVIAGYRAYVELVKDEFPDKRLIVNGMHGEAQRCREALAASRQGNTVTMVCSGDAGVYGMASLLLELAQEGDVIEVVPGVTAALSASALLGAPVSGDFAVISLSDLLTPWDVIEKRLDCAALGDFVIALYNPSSMKRADHLARACDILLRHKSPATPCGWARSIGREGQETGVLTLAELRDETVDMFTTVIVGCAQTIMKGGALVTPRGYRL